MKCERNLKLPLFIITAFLAGIAFGILGVSKYNFASKVPGFSKEKPTLTKISTSKICTPEAVAKNPTLFISCGGFLE